MTEEIDQEVSSMCNLSEGIFEKGIEAGIVRGRAEGKAEGIAAGKLEAAKDLLASCFDEETVIKLLKLSADQIKALKNLTAQ